MWMAGLVIFEIFPGGNPGLTCLISFFCSKYDDKVTS